jgi:hypothetical protein
MNGRMYDPLIGRFLSPDSYVQAPESAQGFNRYAYCMNNPLKYTDPSGNKVKWWQWLIGADILGGGAISAAGIIAGSSAVTTSTMLAPEVLMTGITTFGTLIAWTTTTYMATSSLFSPIEVTIATIQSFWDPKGAGRKMNNSVLIDFGWLVTDHNKNFLGQTWELTSRLSWQFLQTLGGNTYSHARNIGGNVDRVDYFGGATFLTNENSKHSNGITLGNYINTNIKDEITGSFEEYVLTDPMYMHEYGHYIDGQDWGPAYLFGIGIPSIISASGSKPIPEDPYGRNTHDVYWTEMRANRRAEKYFKKYYGVNWDYESTTNSLFWKYPLRYE